GGVRRRVPKGAVERTRALADGGGQSFARVAAAPPARACARPRVRIACRGGACRAGVVPQTLRPAPSPGPAFAPARVAPPRRQPLLRARWGYHFRRKRSNKSKPRPVRYMHRLVPMEPVGLCIVRFR